MMKCLAKKKHVWQTYNVACVNGEATETRWTVHKYH